MNDLRKRFRPRGVEFFLLYSKEAHPGARWPRTPRSRERLIQAREAVETLEITAKVLVEPPGEPVRAAYGLKPSMVFVVDRDGTVAQVQQWSFPESVEEVLEELLETAEDERR